MEKMSWDEYYANFYSWSFSTQKAYSYILKTYGSADEVVEIIMEFAWNDEKFANQFTNKALSAGVEFMPEHIFDLNLIIDKPTLTRMAKTVSIPFSREQLEELYLLIDDDAFNEISQKLNIDIFDYDEEIEEVIPEDDETIPKRSKPKSGIMKTLFGIMAERNSSSKSGSKRHNGRCNGDCANCPPHYGYRYGRWYYGHHHVEGCEFGGNKESGA